MACSLEARLPFPSTNVKLWKNRLSNCITRKKISVKSTAPLLYVQLPRSFLDPFFECAGHKTWPRAKDRWLLRTGSLTVEGKTVSSHLENGRSSLAVSWPGSQANSPGPSADPLRQTNGPHRTFFANQSERS